MSSATPMASRVRDVLLNTSAPVGSKDRTAVLASGPESTRRHVIPLPSSAAAAARSWASVARCANSATASALGPLLRRSFGAAMGDGALMSFATDLGETPVDQRDGHRSLADRRRTTFDRPAANVAGGEQPGSVGLERQGRARQRPSILHASLRPHIGPGPEVAGLVGREPKARESL